MVLEKLATETRNENTMNLDQMSILDILKVMNDEDKGVIKAIEKELPKIEETVNLAIQTFNYKRRVIYVETDTSGRLGVLDAVECVQTLGSPPEMVQGIIEGVMKAIADAVEGAEDNEELGQMDLKEMNLTENDTVIGIAASGRTPYVIGALQYANDQKANTVSISCNADAKMSAYGQV